MNLVYKYFIIFDLVFLLCKRDYILKNNKKMKKNDYINFILLILIIYSYFRKEKWDNSKSLKNFKNRNGELLF